MADARGSSTAPLAVTALCNTATEYDFFQLMRRVECSRPDLPRLGSALLPSHEVLRAEQRPSLGFAPSAIVALSPLGSGAQAERLRLEVAFFGLFGPHGALPTPMTEYVLESRERARREQRRDAVSDFLNLFHHRLLLLLYRVWAASRPAVSHDRPEQDSFAGYVASLFGALDEPPVDRNAPIATPSGPSAQSLHMAARLADPRGNAEGLEALISDWLGVEVELEPLVGEWLTIPDEYAWRLGAAVPASVPQLGVLGEGSILGPQVWERQHKFRLVIGPVDADTFRSLAPRSKRLRRLCELVQGYTAGAARWDLRLRVTAGAITPTRLDGSHRLGETTYLIDTPTERIVDHLVDPLAS